MGHARWERRVGWASLGLWASLGVSRAVLADVLPAQTADPNPPTAGSRNDVVEQARSRLSVAPGLRVEAWATEPLVQDITSMDFDGSGRAYVVETGRRRTSVFDIRNFKDWVEDDLALRTVEDRARFLTDRKSVV